MLTCRHTLKQHCALVEDILESTIYTIVNDIGEP